MPGMDQFCQSRGGRVTRASPLPHIYIFPLRRLARCLTESPDTLHGSVLIDFKHTDDIAID